MLREGGASSNTGENIEARRDWIIRWSLPRAGGADDDLGENVMARGHHRGKEMSGPSQRALRIGERACFTLMLFSISTPALAEVCDKAVGEGWMPSHGPVWLFNPVGFPFALAFLIGWLVLAAMSKHSWSGFTGAVVISLLLALDVADRMLPDKQAIEMWLMMLREGCVSTRTRLMDTGALAVFALAYAFLGFRARYSGGKTA
jgi:hypothetical protein